MPRQLYIENWPFKPEKPVLLRWVQSPRQRTDEKQWCVTVYFETMDGRWHPFEVPWGMVPLLRLGQRYVNGFMLPEECIGERTSVDLCSTPSLVKAKEIFGVGFFPEDAMQAGTDFCFLFPGSPHPVVLPVHEAVRVLLAPNRALAYGLFEPQYLDKIVADASVKDGCLQLEFSKEVALKSLSKPVVSHLARLLFDHSFREAWESVARERFLEAGPHRNHASWPLTCRLPELKPTWNVRLLPLNGIFLILEVLGVEAVAELPFSGVRYSHPKMAPARKAEEKRKSASTKEEGGAVQRDGKGKLAAVSVGLKGPRAPREPRELPGPPLPLLSLTVKSIAREIVIATTQGHATSVVTNKKKVAREGTTQSIAVVSLTDESPPGPDRLPAGEFNPVEPCIEGLKLSPPPMTCSSSMGLQALADMLDYLQGSSPATLKLDWCIEFFPQVFGDSSLKDSPFARVGALRRAYALVRLQWPIATAWALEFGQPDRRALSTLLLQPSALPSQLKLKVLVEKIICKALTSDGNWREPRLNELRATNELRYVLVRHLSRRPDTWGRRLYHKAALLAGASPAYIKRSS